MKKIAVYILGSLLITTTSCKKYLEKEPDNRATLSSPEKVSQLLGTAYPDANYMTFAEALSDNAGDKGTGTVDNTNTDPFFFRDVRDDQQDSPEYYWYACYAAVAAANQALATCNSAANPNEYSAQKGEALLARAYSHFMLVTLFSKAYDPATASSDPGIPYVTVPETVVIKQYERKTVAYVYDMIEKDIVEGLPLIDDKGYKVPRYHFTKAAANAFAARFYLYKKDYTKAVQYASAAVPNFLPNLRPWNTTYQNLGLNDLPLVYEKATEPANLLLIGTASWYANGFRYATYRYGLTASIQSDVFENPVPVAGGQWAFRTGTVGSGNIAVPKISQHFAYESPTSNFGIGYVMVPALTVEEVLFNKAEANTYLGNFGAAITDLNTYASTRILNYNASTNSITQSKLTNYYGTSDVKAALITLILEYKRAEFVQEGMRWFDILRYNIPVVHTTIAGQVLTLPPGDPRRLLQIPAAAKLSGVEQNPR